MVGKLLLVTALGTVAGTALLVGGPPSSPPAEAADTPRTEMSIVSAAIDPEIPSRVRVELV
ncbi:hypothetical protein [Kitasatospora camelliae]|uniref:Uncharacterized protein n=1 Tax=Kitasatospora camelliae TaxID=3156397 RepID=A0AAU8K760_9ACTN